MPVADTTVALNCQLELEISKLRSLIGYFRWRATRTQDGMMHRDAAYFK